MFNLKKKYTMKKLLVISILAILATASFAGNRTRTTANVKSGAYITFGGSATLDTIGVSDTLNYITFIETTKKTIPYIQLSNTKVRAATATVAVTFWESLDGTNFTQVKSGKLQGAYTKSLSLSTSGNSYINFDLDTGHFNGRYLKVRLVTSSTANVMQTFTYKLKVLEK